MYELLWLSMMASSQPYLTVCLSFAVYFYFFLAFGWSSDSLDNQPRRIRFVLRLLFILRDNLLASLLMFKGNWGMEGSKGNNIDR